jgi:hypothetical protein
MVPPLSGSVDAVEVKSLDYLIRPLQERGWDRQAEGLGGLQIYTNPESSGSTSRISL